MNDASVEHTNDSFERNGSSSSVSTDSDLNFADIVRERILKILSCIVDDPEKYKKIPDPKMKISKFKNDAIARSITNTAERMGLMVFFGGSTFTKQLCQFPIDMPEDMVVAAICNDLTVELICKYCSYKVGSKTEAKDVLNEHGSFNAFCKGVLYPKEEYYHHKKSIPKSENCKKIVKYTKNLVMKNEKPCTCCGKSHNKSISIKQAPLPENCCVVCGVKNYKFANGTVQDLEHFIFGDCPEYLSTDYCFAGRESERMRFCKDYESADGCKSKMIRAIVCNIIYKSHFNKRIMKYINLSALNSMVMNFLSDNISKFRWFDFSKIIGASVNEEQSCYVFNFEEFERYVVRIVQKEIAKNPPKMIGYKVQTDECYNCQKMIQLVRTLPCRHKISCYDCLGKECDACSMHIKYIAV